MTRYVSNLKIISKRQKTGHTKNRNKVEKKSKDILKR